MAAMSSGPSRRAPSRRKGGTQSTRAHRFESFSQRISRLKIDPVHKVRRSDLDSPHDEQTATFFRSRLEHWADLNLSENFTEFLNQASPLCESLPQLLHHEEQIMELLTKHIGRKDSLSMEPLLNLLAEFAHDLGSKFEKHFSSSVSLVVSVAASHQAPEVIEWSFTCLAWMFKFLSRLLVPDLRELLRLMLPYLGKTRQKHYVTRFAAESLAFLVRKAVSAHLKGQQALMNAVSFLFANLSEVDASLDASSYEKGIMALFSEAIQGVNNSIHSHGAEIFLCMIRCATKAFQHQNLRIRSVLSGVLIRLIHHTDVEQIQPISTVIQEYTESLTKDSEASETCLGTHLLFLLIATRKGSRVRDWGRVNEICAHLLRLAVSIPEVSTKSLLPSIACAMQTSPMDDLLPVRNPLLSCMSEAEFGGQFPAFCDLLAKLGPERFRSTVHASLQQFIQSHWRQYDAQLCLLLPRLADRDCLVSQSPGMCQIILQQPWLHRIIEGLRHPGTEVQDTANLHTYLRLIEILPIPPESILIQPLTTSLHELAKGALSSPSTSPTPLQRLAVGQCLKTYIRIAKQEGTLDRSLWSLICAAAPTWSSMELFLNGVMEFLLAEPQNSDISNDAIDILLDTLATGTSHHSHDIRLLCLRILEVVLTRLRCQDLSAVSLAITIESTPLNLQSMRTVSMHVRKLASLYKKVHHDQWLGRIIPTYFFGLFSMRSNQLWKDACGALASVCEQKTGELVVANVTSQWLQEQPIEPAAEQNRDQVRQQASKLTEYQCSNVEQIKEMFAETVMAFDDPTSQIVRAFHDAHDFVPAKHPSARTFALQVFNAVPQVAEKRSRLLVPVFLSWTGIADDGLATLDTSSKTSVTLPAEDPPNTWSLQDRKAMIELFSKFTNPRVLYKSEEVYIALLDLLTVGKSDIQKAALQALFTWKLPGVKPYEENLLNILDDARFREEIAVFLDSDDEQAVIQQEHRNDFMPILLRILYGKTVSRAGTKSGHSGQETRRKAVLRTISRLHESDFTEFLHISFGSLADLRLIDHGALRTQVLSHDFIPTTKQHGLLRMIETMFETLQSQMAPSAEQSLNAVLYSLLRANRELRCSQPSDAEFEPKDGSFALLRSVRQTGLRCLDLIFANCGDMRWTSYLPLIFEEIINPALQNFAIETAQGISRLLRLFSTWAGSSNLAGLLWEHNEVLLPSIANCINVKSARDEVRVFVLDKILLQTTRTLLDETNAVSSSSAFLDGFSRHVPYLLSQLDILLQSEPSRVVLASCIGTLSSLAPFVKGTSGTGRLLVSTVFLLSQPSNKVSPKTKGDILTILQRLLFLETEGHFDRKLYTTICALFDYFRDGPNRERLCQVLETIAASNKDLILVAELCTSLNAKSTRTLDELDIDRALSAFNTINEQIFDQLTAIQWLPVLYNFLFYLKNADEFSIRSSASYGLKKFIGAAFDKNRSDRAEIQELAVNVLFPALGNGVKAESELVRAEHVSLTGFLIGQSTGSSELDDMKGLLANHDEEASFFNNVLHIQQHRRLRSLRRLAVEVKKGVIQSTTINTFFLPLLEHFVFDHTDDENAHNLTAEAVTTIGVLLEWLEWHQFSAIMRRYRSYMESKPGLEKGVIRLLSRAADALCRAVKGGKPVDTSDTLEIDDYVVRPSSRLATSLPSGPKMTKELIRSHISPLSSFVHNKEESEVSLRIPTAITIIKLLNLLPEDQSSLLLSPVFLDVCNILKSRSQDSRDIARRTLAEMALIMGPSCFSYLLKELRTSLARGYQLHVLAFTVHSLLVATADQFQRGDIDPSIPTLVNIVIDDIFGTAGQEKDAEGYISRMKEVKSSKSFDSMELLSRTATVRHLGQLIRPIQSLLTEKFNAQSSRKIDELLRRVGLGVSRNPDAASLDLLVFAYEVVQGVYRASSVDGEKSNDHVEDRRLVHLEGARRGISRGRTTSQVFKLIKFAFDMLRSIFHKHEDLLTPANFHGFLPMIGDAMVQGHEEVKVSAMRLLSTTIKLPMAELDQNAKVYLAEAVKVIKQAPSTNSEGAQAALKLVASILRERRSASIKASDIAYILQRVQPDIEEPDRQGVTFNFIKAVLTRKMMIPEVYELLDSVGTIMVTNQTKAIRDVAKGVYLHFLMEYPQAKNRWSKQLKFFVKNLDYDYSEGRQVIMEAVHVLLTRSGDTLAQDVVNTFFMPVVMRLVNDESTQCREMAAVLLGEIYNRADSENMRSILATLKPWLNQMDNVQIVSMSLQAYRILLDSDVVLKERDIEGVKTSLTDIIQVQTNKTAERHWEPLFYALQLFSTLVKVHPHFTLSSKCAPVWSAIQDALSYPHTWVKHSAAGLVGLMFHDIGKASIESGLSAIPLPGTRGLMLQAHSMVRIMKSSLRAMRQPALTEDLALQMERNLVFLGRCFDANELTVDDALLDAFASGSSKDVAAESETDEGINEGAGEEAHNKTALQYIFEQISSTLRREPLSLGAQSLIPKSAMLQLLGALCSHVSVLHVKDSLALILLPLLQLTDPDIPPPHSSDPDFETAYKALTTVSHEILDLLQKKIGTTEFVAHAHDVRTKIKERREGRKVKRRIEKVADPEKVGKEKRRKEERKKFKRKERAMEHRGKRRGW